MTNQSNDKAVKRTPGDYIRRADGSWNVLPLVLGALIIAGVGYIWFGDRFTGQDALTSPTIEEKVQ